MSDTTQLPIILSATPQAAIELRDLFDKTLAAFDGGAFETVAGDAINAALVTGDTSYLDAVLHICDRDRNLPGGQIHQAIQNTVVDAVQLTANGERYKKVAKKPALYLCEPISKGGVTAPRWMHSLRREFDRLYEVRSTRGEKKAPATFEEQMEVLCSKMLKKGLGESMIDAAYAAGKKAAFKAQAVVKAA